MESVKNRSIKVSELAEGQQFKLTGNRKFQTVNKLINLGVGDNIPTEHKGKILVVLSNCAQYCLNPDTSVIVQ